MKINTLAGISCVNAETIRKYRNRNLLRPECDPENGYYKYSQADFLNLLYIRKLRGANLSLDSIKSTYYCEESEKLCKEYEDTLHDLQKQIRQLKRKEMMLRLTYQHHERDAVSPQDISVVQSFSTKYDMYFEDEHFSDEINTWIRNIDLCTLVINIEKYFFETTTLPKRIPFRIGMGTYREVLEEEQIAIPESAVEFPEGQYLSFFLDIENLQSFECAKLDAVRRYLKKNGLRPLSDTTAYLYRVTFTDTGYNFHFCVGLRVG